MDFFKHHLTQQRKWLLCLIPLCLLSTFLMHHVIGSLYGMVATKGINVESGSWEKETPKAGQKSKDSYHSLNFTHRPFLDEEMDTLQLVPPKYLNNYKNPCWYEFFTKDDPHENAVALAFPDELVECFATHSAEMTRKASSQMQKHNGTALQLKCLPYFYIAGFSKCGTSDLYSALLRHPQIEGGLVKEPTYWNRIRYNVVQDDIGPMSKKVLEVPYNPPRPLKHYIDFYNIPAEKIKNQEDYFMAKEIHHNSILVDGTPNYMYDFDGWYKMLANEGLDEPKYTVADMIHRLTPQAKIIVILREPAARLFSDYTYFMMWNEKSHDDFQDKALSSIRLLQKCFEVRSERACLYDHEINMEYLPVRLRVSLYYPFIRDWLKVFPREQLYIIRLEDYSENQKEILGDIVQFLDIDPYPFHELTLHEKRNKKRTDIGSMDLTLKKTLQNYFEPWNRKLADLLEDDRFLWNDV